MYASPQHCTDVLSVQLCIALCRRRLQLFQSKFIAVISPNASRFESMQWTLLNSGVSLVGCELVLRRRSAALLHHIRSLPKPCCRLGL